MSVLSFPSFDDHLEHLLKVFLVEIINSEMWAAKISQNQQTKDIIMFQRVLLILFK